MKSVLLGFVVAAVCTGCGEARVSSSTAVDQLTLYSIDGNRRIVEATKEAQEELPKDATKDPEEQFHTFPVLGKVDVKDPEKRKEILTAFQEGIDRSDGTMNKCFWPRHGIRVVKGQRTIDYVICFECLQFEKHEGSSESNRAITRIPQTLFNQVLKDAGVPLATPAESGDSN